MHAVHHSPIRVGILVLSFLLAIIAGGLGALFMIGVKESEDTVEMRPLLFEDRTTRVRERGQDLSDVYERVRPSILTVVRARAVREDTSWPDRIAVQGDVVSPAVAMTTDGWLILPLPPTSPRLEAFDSGGVHLTIGSVIKEPGLGIAFAKVLGTDLHAAAFSPNDSHAPSLGYRVTEKRVEYMPLTAKIYPSPVTSRDVVRSSDLLEKRLNPDDDDPTPGFPVVDSDGALVGITAKRGIIPISTIKEMLSRVLRSGSARGPTLGLAYIDLAHTLGLSDQHSPGTQTGALVVSESSVILLPTPQGTVRLKNGDRILSVNDESIDSNRSFSELIAQYKPKDSIILKVEHGGNVRDVTVQLQ